MQYLNLFVVFAIGLAVQISSVAGAEVEYGKKAGDGAPAVVEVQPVRADAVTERSETSQKKTYAYSQYDEPAAVLGARASYHPKKDKVAGIQPMVGGSGYFTSWRNNISNRYTLGIILDVMLSHSLALEGEAGYSKYDIAYTTLTYPSYITRHPFDQYQIGGNLKYYLSRSAVQPYIGGGLMALHYRGMQRGWTSYDETLGAAQAIAGLDVPISDDVSIGGRFAWVVPAFSRPQTVSNQIYSAPGFEEAGAMNTQLWRVMGSVKVSL